MLLLFIDVQLHLKLLIIFVIRIFCHIVCILELLPGRIRANFVCMFTSREGYPSKRANPKDSPGLQAKFHRQGNLTIRNNLI